MYMLSLFVQVQDFTDKVNFYVMNAVTFFKSMWPEVKCNAALFVGKSPDVTALQSLVPRSHISLHGDVTRTDLVNTYQYFMPLCVVIFVGYMLGNLPLQKSGIVSKEHVCEGEFSLLK